MEEAGLPISTSLGLFKYDVSTNFDPDCRSIGKRHR